MGVYSTSQFLGAFLGGTLGGLLANVWGLNAVFIGCALLALGWWAAMWRMPSPPPLSSEVMALHETQPDAMNLLMELPDQEGHHLDHNHCSYPKYCG